MKKLKLPQPYASMVIAGTLQTIPNLWNDINYGEKIFIYADYLDPEYNNGLDYSKVIHRKIYNDIFLGNITDNFEDLPIKKFIGYVRVCCNGMTQEGWTKNQQPTLFVTDPHKFNIFTDYYHMNITYLDNLTSRPMTVKTIKRKGDHLFVPVGKRIWQLLKNQEECWGVCMFWENYMNSFANILFSLKEDFEDYVTEVHFQYNRSTIVFSTCSDIGQDVLKKDDTGETYFILSFDLDCRINKNSFDIRNSKKYHIENRNTHNEEDGEEYLEHKYRPYIRIISTPMGGMTKWRRKK